MLESEVPTLRDALRKAQLIREQKITMQEENQRNIVMDEIMDEVVNNIIGLWKKSNDKFEPPIVISTQSIKRRLLTAWKKVSDIARKRITKKETIKMWEDKLDSLLDITTCKCKIETCVSDTCVSSCTGYHINCSCPRPQKLPTLELEWIFYERQKKGEKSGMMMSTNDRVETERQQKAMKRKQNEAERIEKALIKKGRRQRLDRKISPSN